jgi:hypothetical protein
VKDRKRIEAGTATTTAAQITTISGGQCAEALAQTTIVDAVPRAMIGLRKRCVSRDAIMSLAMSSKVAQPRRPEHTIANIQ